MAYLIRSMHIYIYTYTLDRYIYIYIYIYMHTYTGTPSLYTSSLDTICIYIYNVPHLSGLGLSGFLLALAEVLY